MGCDFNMKRRVDQPNRIQVTIMDDSRDLIGLYEKVFIVRGLPKGKVHCSTSIFVFLWSRMSISTLHCAFAMRLGLYPVMLARKLFIFLISTKPKGLAGPREVPTHNNKAFIPKPFLQRQETTSTKCFYPNLSSPVRSVEGYLPSNVLDRVCAHMLFIGICFGGAIL